MEVRKTPLYIAADGTARKELVNVGGGTLYYKSTEGVSSSSNDGSLTVGRSRELTSGVWVVSASESSVAVRPLSASQELVAASVVGTFGRRLLRKMNEGLEDCSIVVVGDSTSASYSSWVGRVLEGIAVRYPTYTVKYRDWTDGNSDYNAASTKQTGTGSKTLTVYNCAVGSKNAHYHMGQYFEAQIASKQPDLLFFAHGHNHGGSTATAEPYWRDGLTVTTQTILRACPLSEIVLIATNPRVDVNKGVQAERQFTTEQIAQLCGFGFVNIHRAFLTADPNVTSLLADEIHPNATGYALWGSEILRLMSPDGGLRTQERSTLEVPVTNVMPNGDFSSFASPPTLTNWTAVNATLSKDTTNYESSNGYSVKMIVATPGSISYMSANLNGNAHRRLQGQWVTMLARTRVPSGAEYTAGRLSISEQNGSHAGSSTSDQLADGEGKLIGTNGFRDFMATRRIATDCTSTNFSVVCSNPGTASQEISVDWVSLTPGIWPRAVR
jgi:lysophospholipase L1-like esterase